MKNNSIKSYKYFIKTVHLGKSDENEIHNIFKLRFNIFCDELKWVTPSIDQLEKDYYDDYAKHFVIFNSQKQIIGTARIITSSPKGFMIDNEFRNLIDVKQLNTYPMDKTVEISRLAILSNYRKKSGNKDDITKYLFYAMYRWSKKNKKKYWIIVVDKIFLVSLSKQYFIKFKLLGEPQIYPDNLTVVAAIINLNNWRFFILSLLIKIESHFNNVIYGLN